MLIELAPLEARVLGSLVEKSLTTPELAQLEKRVEALETAIKTLTQQETLLT